jgi:hypothetical protein
MNKNHPQGEHSEFYNPFNREGSRRCAKNNAITCESIEFIHFAYLWFVFAVKNPVS